MDDKTNRIERLLLEKCRPTRADAEVKVNRYNPGAIRIRGIDRSLEEKSIAEREVEVRRILETPPDSVQMEISVCLLITPDEQETSLMNLEFEEPLPARF